jgi:lysophospholipase L1-like esterase
MIQFMHAEKTVNGQAGQVNATTVGALWGLDENGYRAYLEHFEVNSRQAAVELLDEAQFAHQVEHLPLRAGAVVAAVGDSITDDLQSWAEILRHALALSRPKDSIRVANLAVSGDATTHLITRFLGAIQLAPQWIVCMIGTNDARFHGLPPQGPLVSPGEMARNLELLRATAAAQCRARWIWMTPATVIPERIPAHWLLGTMQISWRSEVLRAAADVIRAQHGPVVDLQAAFGENPNPRLLLSDGLHPSLEGQKVILKALVARWAQES